MWIVYSIKKYPNKKWNWNAVSKNPNVNSDIVESNPQIPSRRSKRKLEHQEEEYGSMDNI